MKGLCRTHATRAAPRRPARQSQAAREPPGRLSPSRVLAIPELLSATSRRRADSSRASLVLAPNRDAVQQRASMCRSDAEIISASAATHSEQRGYLPALTNAMPHAHLPGLSLIIWQQSEPQAHLYFPVSLAVFALPST